MSKYQDLVKQSQELLVQLSKEKNNSDFDTFKEIVVKTQK